MFLGEGEGVMGANAGPSLCTDTVRSNSLHRYGWMKTLKVNVMFSGLCITRILYTVYYILYILCSVGYSNSIATNK